MGQSLDRDIRLARDMGVDALTAVLEEASAGAELAPQDKERLLDLARQNARANPVAYVEGAGWGDAEDNRPPGVTDLSIIFGPRPGRPAPRVIHLKMSTLLSNASSAIGATLGALTPLGWWLVALGAALALRDFWKKRVTLEGLHGQILFELYQSTDSGKSHKISADALFANLNATRVQARQPQLDRPAFDTALALLTATGLVGLNTGDGSLQWTEMTIEMPRP